MPVIFVYGSLKKNKKLNYYLKKAKFVSSAYSCLSYSMILSPSGWYPYLFEKKSGYKIKGEVYIIDYSLLKKLDRLEETPHYYIRKKICVKIKRKTISAWCYFTKKNKNFLKKELIEEF